MAGKKKKGFAIASLVLGLLFIFGIPFSVLAIVFGVIQLINIKKHPKDYGGKGMAIAGIVLGAAGGLIALITGIFLSLLTIIGLS
jgi:hypothetical protein